MLKQFLILFFLAFQFLSCAQTKTAIVAQKDSILPEYFSGLKFRSIGPALTSGRISDFAVNPTNHSEYYIASSSGGVWKTINKGTTFTPIFDSQGSYSIGCVTLDPQNPAIVWVGSGENNNQRSVSYGDGIYKSNDSGKTWSNMGLKSSEHIAKVIVDPRNSDVVYVAAYGPVWNEGGDRGVFKTNDGGKTWTNVKSVSKYTGCNDLIMDPNNPEILYAAFHQRMRKVFTYIGGGPETGLFKSTDGGNTWNPLTNGLPKGELGRIGIAVSSINPNLVYAVIEGEKESGGIYRSQDKGASWSKMSGTQSSGNYYQEIECDPFNEDKIYIADSYYKVSYDGGKTVKNLGEINKHIDNHAIWVDPTDGNHLMVGCDGGIYESYDQAGTWDFKGNLPVTQFYKVSTDNDLPFYSVHGGTQDNFSIGGPSRTTSMNGIVNADWYITSSGDGFETQVDPKNPNIIYAQAQYGALTRFDRKNGEYLFIQPIEGDGDPGLKWNWDSPLLISSHDNKRLYYGANKVFRTDDQGNTWNTISPDLTRQVDRNKLEIMGKVWSVDAIAKNGSTDIFGQTTTIAESSFDGQVLLVGTDDGLIQLTMDGGKNWQKIDNLPGVPAMSYVHQIITSLHDKSTAYVCFNHHRYGDFKPYVLKTTDFGKTWKSIASNLPIRGSVYSIAEDNIDPNLLFVGTEFGLFFSNNAGATWTQLKNGLPTIAVRDIEIQRRETDLVLGTFGRGFYVLDDYSPLRSINKMAMSNSSMILPIKPALIYVERKPLGLRDKGHMGSSYYSAPNPKVGAVISYYLNEELKGKSDQRKALEKSKSEKGELIIYPSLDSLEAEETAADPYLLFTITDRNGKVLRQLKEKPTKGLNRLVWDFRTSDYSPINARREPAADQLFSSATEGFLVPPGTYGVTMQKVVDGITTSLAPIQNFDCMALDQASIPNLNRNANSSFLEEVASFSKLLDKSSSKITKTEHYIASINKAAIDIPAKTDEIIKEAFGLSKEIIELKKSISGDDIRAKYQFETANSISGRIGTILNALTNSTAPVPGMYKESFDIAKKQFAGIESKIDALYRNALLLVEKTETAGGPYIDR